MLLQEIFVLFFAKVAFVKQQSHMNNSKVSGEKSYDENHSVCLPCLMILQSSCFVRRGTVPKRRCEKNSANRIPTSVQKWNFALVMAPLLSNINEKSSSIAINTLWFLYIFSNGSPWAAASSGKMGGARRSPVANLWFKEVGDTHEVAVPFVLGEGGMVGHQPIG